MPALGVTYALDLVQRILDEAARQSVPVTVTVVDTGGHLVASARGDQVSYTATEFARRKAITAATFNAATSALSDSLGQDPHLRDALTSSPDLLLLPGGFPVTIDGACVGGVGIAGGHYQQDHAVGDKALAGAGGN